MRTASLLTLLSLLLVAADARAGTVRVPDDFSTIQQAVDAAQVDEEIDRIRIERGTYAGFRVDDADGLVIVGRKGHRIVGDVRVADSFSVFLDKLRVKGDIFISSSILTTVSRCRVSEGGILVLRGSDHVVERCRVEDAPFEGISIDAEDFILRRNLVFDPETTGISAFGSGGRLKGNLVEGGASEEAIIVFGDTIRVLQNQIRDVRNVGILVHGSAHRIKGNEVLGADDDGIQCRDGDSNLFKGNLLKRVNDGFDIKATCSNNQIVDNRVKNVRADGIDLESDSNEVLDNHIKGTANVGIELPGSNNLVSGNKIENTGEVAIREELEGANTLIDND